MEVPGLVLGGIPLVIAALDNYQKYLEPAKKYWKYQSTLKLIRMNVFIQQEQLKVTLRSCIGLERPTHRDLQDRMLQLYPDGDKCQQFTNIISHMEKIVEELMESLDIDAQGKPKWTKESPERAHWEWRRIRRSFGEKERQAFFDELQRLNTGLMYIFEKAEVPSDDSDPMVQKLQVRFNLSHCDAVRQNAQLLHEALSTTVHRCNFGEHQGIFRLDWHTETSREPGMFTLTLNPGRQPDGWKTLHVKFPESD